MAEQEFFRRPTEDERRDFKDIGPYKGKDVKSKFLEMLGKKRLEAGKKKIPFFKKAAMDDFDEYYKEEVKKSMRVHGYVKAEEIKPVKIDWNKYSSPDNIEFIEEKEVRDPHASKKHPFDVFVKSFRYKFKGYGQPGVENMSVMEEEMFAVRRARAMYEGKEEDIKKIPVSLAEKNSMKYRGTQEKEETAEGVDVDAPEWLKKKESVGFID